MIKTAYYAICKDGTGVAISQKKPFWFKGAHAPELAPTDELRAMPFDKRWAIKYKKDVLAKLDAKVIAEKYDGKTLCCYEKDIDNCHRKIVAEWLVENGIVVDMR